jgi:2,5-diamino-6-(ribosylamino)-4(3H)-pyrimidinone 5'-phosphate reductase
MRPKPSSMQKKAKTASRPYVICLMQTSVDAKIKIDRWPDPDAAEGEYERVHDLHRADGWLCGRVTMAYFARHQPKPAGKPVPPAKSVRDRGDFMAPAQGVRYAIAADARGKLKWRSNEVNGDRLIVLLSSRASQAHRAELRARRISYLISPGSRIDFAAALVKLRKHFGIARLMLEGGGRINAALLHAGLIDELSLLLSPVIDGASATTGLFETDLHRPGLRARGLRLTRVLRRPGDVLWLRYRVLN